MKKMKELFKNRTLCIATMHGKEKVLAPLLEEALGVTCMLPSNINTDALGTFSGEVERVFDPVLTAKLKCKMAMTITGTNLAVASEGSFGPHPSAAFVPCDEEILVFIDRQNDLDIVVRELSVKTNYSQARIETFSELAAFAKQTQFPQHALILKSCDGENPLMLKDIKSWASLKSSYAAITENGRKAVHVQTDMRAMNNPMRMDVIAKCGRKLVDTILSACPSCSSPGFSVQTIKPGLPCELCAMPTRSTLAHVYSCKKCLYTHERKFPHGKKQETPTYCDFCNP